MEKETAKTIDEYILDFSPEVQLILQKTRKVIKEAAPEAKEKISWGMPTFYNNGNLMHFAAHKNHMGLYPGEECILHFAKKLENHKTSKGAAQFPYNKEIPYALISEMTKFRTCIQ